MPTSEVDHTANEASTYSHFRSYVEQRAERLDLIKEIPERFSVSMAEQFGEIVDQNAARRAFFLMGKLVEIVPEDVSEDELIGTLYEIVDQDPYDQISKIFDLIEGKLPNRYFEVGDTGYGFRRPYPSGFEFVERILKGYFERVGDSRFAAFLTGNMIRLFSVEDGGPIADVITEPGQGAGEFLSRHLLPLLFNLEDRTQIVVNLARIVKSRGDDVAISIALDNPSVLEIDPAYWEANSPVYYRIDNKESETLAVAVVPIPELIQDYRLALFLVMGNDGIRRASIVDARRLLAILRRKE